jgi:large subunit ribosomal protein L10
MNKERKAEVVEEIARQIEESDAVIAVDYRGISVPQAAELRARLRQADATFRVVKNRLTLRAAEQAGADELRELLEGPTALTFVHGDAALAAKALNDFARAGEAMEFKGGRMGEQALTVDEIKSIARLPALDVLQAQLVGTVSSPLTGLVRGLNQLIAGLAAALQQVHDQGLVGGDEEPAEASTDEQAEAPAEEAPGEPAPEEAPAEETPGEEAPAEETPAEGAPEEGGEQADNAADASADAEDQDEDAAEA